MYLNTGMEYKRIPEGNRLSGASLCCTNLIRPTGALDSHAARQLLDTFCMLCKEYNATILMVTHDVMAASYCDRILFMKDGEIKTALKRGQENKQTFFTDILKKIEWIEGESHDVLEVVNP